MKSYLEKYFDYKTSEIALTYDDLPLWSSIPGNLLLENIQYGNNKTIVDIGFGTGFPIIPLASRFGSSCKLYGIDLWESAIKQTEQKLKIRAINNVELLHANASKIPLNDKTIDIVTSNLGINNFQQPKAVISECYRILKPNGSLFLTSNLIGTFQEFYHEFEQTAVELNLDSVITGLQTHINTRTTNDNLDELFASVGFLIADTKRLTYSLKYSDGTAFLNDYFTIMCFLPAWKELIPNHQLVEFFDILESKLNKLSLENGGLQLSVPIVMKEIKRP